MGLTAEGWCESERASFTGRATDRDGSAHQSHKLRCDRESEAGAPVLPSRRVVLLLKCVKDALVVVFRNADASIANCESQIAHFRFQIGCRQLNAEVLNLKSPRPLPPH